MTPLRHPCPTHRFTRSLLLCLTLALSCSAAVWNWSFVPGGSGGGIDGVHPNPNRQGEYWACPDISPPARWRDSEGKMRTMKTVDTWYRNQVALSRGIAFDRADPDVVYAGFYSDETRNHLWKTTNSGTSWTELDLVARSSNRDRYFQNVLAADPYDANVVYSATRDGLFRSLNAGSTWARVPNAPTGDLTQAIAGCTFVVCDPYSGSVNGRARYVYAGFAYTGTYRSADGGQTWTQIGTIHGNAAAFTPNGTIWIANNTDGLYRGTTSLTKVTTITPRSGYGFSCIRTSPHTTGEMLLTEWRNGNFNQIYRGSFGDNWTAILPTTAEPSLFTGMPTYTADKIPNLSSISSVAYDPHRSGWAMFTFWWGVMRTKNMYAAAPTWEFIANGHEMQVISAGVSPRSGNYTLLTAGYDSANFLVKESNLDSLVTGPVEWCRSTQMNGMQTMTANAMDICKANPNVFVYVGDRAGPAFSVTTDGGATFTNRTTGLPGKNGNIAVAAAVNGSIYDIVWMPWDSPPKYSTNLGATWNAVNGLPQFFDSRWNAETTSVMLCSDGLDGTLFYAFYFTGTVAGNDRRGLLYRSSDRGRNFSVVYDQPESVGLPGFSATEDRPYIRAANRIKGTVGVCVASAEPRSVDGLYLSQNAHTASVTFTKVPGVQSCHSFDFGRPAVTGGKAPIYIHGRVNNLVGIWMCEDYVNWTWTRIDDGQTQFTCGSAPLDFHPQGRPAIVADQRVYGRVYIMTDGLGAVVGEM